jgi:hypothetical protein
MWAVSGRRGTTAVSMVSWRRRKLSLRADDRSALLILKQYNGLCRNGHIAQGCVFVVCWRASTGRSGMREMLRGARRATAAKS